MGEGKRQISAERVEKEGEEAELFQKQPEPKSGRFFLDLQHLRGVQSTGSLKRERILLTDISEDSDVDTIHPDHPRNMQAQSSQARGDQQRTNEFCRLGGALRSTVTYRWLTNT